MKARPGTRIHTLTHMYIQTQTRSQISPDYVVSALRSYDTDSNEFIHLLISCWQVTESLLRLGELWRVQDLNFGLGGRKLTRLQLISGLSYCEEISPSRDLRFCNGNSFAKLSTSLKYCQDLQF